MTETEQSAIKSKDDYYEDDFEQDSTSDTGKDIKASEDSAISTSPNMPPSSTTDTEASLDKDMLRKEKSSPEASDTEYDVDADAYNFTEDQKRAMMELMVQKQEDSDLLDEEPPEYNVKGRLEQLNAELANDPTPVEGEREFKVGFKPEIVDLVAPPPTFSDEESAPNSARGESEESEKDFTPTSPIKENSPQYDKFSDNEANSQKQFVVEREGNFEVLNANELTASERALYVAEEDNTSKEDQNHKTKQDSSVSSSCDNRNANANDSSTNVNPRPPARPRPNTATTTSTRRNVRPSQSPRPKSANNPSGSNTSLDNFNYNSPYAMTLEQKEQAKQLAKKYEEEKVEKAKRKQEEDDLKRRENENAFRAWLEAKREEDKKRQNQNGEKNEEDKEEENTEAFRAWLKEKRSQGKKDKLLKKRQQQEMMEGYYVRPREECDKAFKEWLRKKNAALRQQQEMERQRNRLYHLQVKRSKKSQALIKAMKESQSFRYVDYYGYRF